MKTNNIYLNLTATTRSVLSLAKAASIKYWLLVVCNNDNVFRIPQITKMKQNTSDLLE